MEARLSDSNGVANVLEGDPQPDLDAILCQWPVLAAVGFEGALISGRGAVIVTVDSTSTQIDYAPGSPCLCHAKLVDEYDLRNQIVIVLRREEMESIFVLGGSPTPAESYGQTTAEAVGATVH